MKEQRKYTCAAVVENYTLDGANTFTLMKHMHEWRHHARLLSCRDAITSKYTRFIKCMGAVGGCERPGVI